MKFASPLEQKLNDEFSLIVPAAWLNSKGLPIAEVQLFNGSLLHSDTLCLSNHKGRERFIKSVLTRATVEAGEVEQALLLIDGNLTTTLAQDLEDDAAVSSRPTQATLLIELASDAEFFHNPNGETYATIQVGGHKETWRIKVNGFRNWLLQRYYRETDRTASSQALQDALGVLHAKALFDGPELQVFLRVAEYDGNIYIDLCNEHWEAVEITSTDWRVVGEPPVRFRRARGMLALPYPVTGGSITELRPFINAGTNAKELAHSKGGDFVLLCAWLVQALRSSGPYPVLALHGEQGSAKSTTARVLRSLLDPNASPLRTGPRNEHDLMIAAANGWCLVLDNLSNISVWLSDSLCRLATGGGFATRELYSDSDEVLFDAQRPVLLNGIEDLVTRSDLLDRTVIAYLPNIPEEKRRTQSEFWAAFESARPRILGSLYDAVSVALRNLSATKLNRLPRMADFAVWATAAEQGLGFEPGAFLAAYIDNRGSVDELALEATPVAAVLMAFIQQQKLWLNTASELLKVLNEHADDTTRKQQGWPKNARSLSNKLRRLAPNLRATGVAVEFDIKEGHKKTRMIRLEYIWDFASVASANVGV